MRKIREAIDVLRITLAAWLWPRGGGLDYGWRMEGDRSERRCVLGKTEVLLTQQPVGYDVYGREGVYRLLKLVRLNERRMSWTCPEPPPSCPMCGAGMRDEDLDWGVCERCYARAVAADARLQSGL
jgi:hypothetical protein